jgi:hypothetical protein
VKLKDAVDYEEKQGNGALNADWVEWLMGFPPGYTNLTSQELQHIKLEERKGLKPSATQSFPKSSHKSPKPSSLRKTDEKERT